MLSLRFDKPIRMLTKTSTLYPVIETVIIDPMTAGSWWLGGACFHDLFSATDGELAGMGLAIIGNVCKALESGTIAWNYDASLILRIAPSAPDLTLPWPGMPDDRPLPLDLAKLPWNTEMFLDRDHEFQYRPHRLALMNRIEDVWTPYVRRLLWDKL